jgi:uncharacterized membrane protein YccF (DUF307 family)
MNFLGNVIWLVFGGFLTGLGYIIGGLVVCLTIIGIPFGVQAMKLGIATMTPFGRTIVPTKELEESKFILFNILWALFFGWEIAVTHLAHAILLAITIAGIPFAKQHIKLIPLSLAPFGRELK